MRYWKLVVIIATAAVVGLALSPSMLADQANEKTILKFSGPVEIPGKVLVPGTYVFKVVDALGDRDIVEVLNKNQTKVYATILTIPDYTDKIHSKPYISFEERPKKAPEAIKAWFYPGDTYGHEMVYAHKRALELAKANHTSVASMPDSNNSETALKQTAIARTTPDDQQESASRSASARQQ